MPKIVYVEKEFKNATLVLIRTADRIAEDYKRRGFNLTLRQLYYQFISRDVFANTEANYNKLGRVVSDARLAGMIDWDLLEDRGREAHGIGWVGHEPPEKDQLIRDAQYGYSLDLWEDQSRRIEVWVEKQALEEVVAKATTQTRSGYFACKGYVSQSEMWAAGQRMRNTIAYGQQPLILHLGDHDPSGIDMTRDIEERLSLFAEEPVEVKRIALNMDQIDLFNPPPNPAKTTDSRFADYRRNYGSLSWELDALRPEMLVNLVKEEIEQYLDRPLFRSKIAEENKGREDFDVVADRWDDVREFLELDEEDE